jgi:hypothetical protein
MLDPMLDELHDIWTELKATLLELDDLIGEAYEQLRERIGRALYRLGRQLQGRQHEPEDWE